MPDVTDCTAEYMNAGFARPDAPDIRTPFIEIDSFRLDRNIAKMQAIATASNVLLRPHIKTHKSIEIARRQIAAGAAGITASKASEAQVFIEAGFPDILMAYPVILPSTIESLLKSARTKGARLAFIAADRTGVQALNAAAIIAETILPVFMKVDVGLGRVGVKPDTEEAIEIARAIDEASNLNFAGLLAHAGHAYGAPSREHIAAIAEAEIHSLVDLSNRLASFGFSDLKITTGSTPTAWGAPIAKGSDEIRPGNYAFLDLTALRLGIATADEIALSVISRVIAVNDRYAIIDAGSKMLSSDHGPHGTGGGGFGKAMAIDGDDGLAAFEVERLSEEHGFLRLDGRSLAVGQRVRIFPNHSCAVVALSDSFIMRDDAGSDRRFTIDGRGKVI